MPQRPPRTLSLVALVLVIGLSWGPSAVASTPPPASAPPSNFVWDWVIGFGGGARPGTGYTPSFEALHFGGPRHPWLFDMELLRQRNSVARTFEASFAPVRGVVRETDRGFVIDTRNHAAPWGHLRLEAHRPHIAIHEGRCLAETERWGSLHSLTQGEPGYVFGTRTQRFGTIARNQMRVVFFHVVEKYRPGCGGGGEFGCLTTASLDVGDYKDPTDVQFEAFRYHRGGVSLSASFPGPQVGTGQSFEGASIGELPNTRIFDRSHLRTSPDGSSMSVKGANGTAFPGRLEYTANQPPSDSGTPGCSQYESVGTSVGNLRVELDAFGEQPIAGYSYGFLMTKPSSAAETASFFDPSAVARDPVHRVAALPGLVTLLDLGVLPARALRLISAR